MSNTGNETTKSRKRNIQRQRVHTEIVKYLLKDIQSGVYVEGQNLPSERALMEEFGVGRPAVRESLAALGRMGLIEICPGVRAKVCKPTVKPLLSEMKDTLQVYSRTPEGWRQLQDLRVLFETAIGRQVARTITQEQLSILRKILDNQARFLERAELRAFAEADISFHRTLVDFMGNSFLGILAEGFGGWLITPLFASMKVYSLGKTSYAAHLRIFEALERRDPDATELAMREHLERVHALYQSAPVRETPEDSTTGHLELLPEAEDSQEATEPRDIFETSAKGGSEAC